jgi:hypothetical protein
MLSSGLEKYLLKQRRWAFRENKFLITTNIIYR